MNDLERARALMQRQFFGLLLKEKIVTIVLDYTLEKSRVRDLHKDSGSDEGGHPDRILKSFKVKKMI